LAITSDFRGPERVGDEGSGIDGVAVGGRVGGFGSALESPPRWVRNAGRAIERVSTAAETAAGGFAIVKKSQ
jgi:hypothetical protein